MSSEPPISQRHPPGGVTRPVCRDCGRVLKHGAPRAVEGNFVVCADCLYRREVARARSTVVPPSSKRGRP